MNQTTLPRTSKAFWLLLITGVCVIGISTSLLLRHFVTAQDLGQSLAISPPTQDLIANPGETVTAKAKIRNNSQTTTPFEVTIQDFTASGEEGQVALTTDSPWSLTSWTTLSPKNFTLAPGDEKEVTATIRIPKDAAGGRYGSFVFKAIPEKPAGKGATVSQQIASLFLLKISGPVDENLMLTDTTTPVFSEFGPVPISLRFENKGNVFVKTYGLVNVTDMFGKKVADIVIPPTNVFPSASRNINVALQKSLLIGKFKATVLASYGESNQPLTSTATFYVFPVRIFFLILVIILALYLMRKRLGKALKALGGKN